ncbi:helix-turn-helix transcriptional regulator [Glutamicibacter uratoxydans]|uniref:helix-turn-helix transcriptional regulator n=1 Tax=Glutamicibacter uratoxydans TaxID=43667 RepID=UPI003D6FDEA4
MTETAGSGLGRLLTVDEYCAWRGISKGAAAQERYLGNGPKFLKLGKSIRYTESSLQAWVNENTRDRT